MTTPAYDPMRPERCVVLGRSMRQIRRFTHDVLRVITSSDFNRFVVPVIDAIDEDRTYGLARGTKLYVISGGMQRGLDRVLGRLLHRGFVATPVPDEWSR